MGNILMFVNDKIEDVKQGFGNYDLSKGFESLGYKIHWISFADEKIIESLTKALQEKIDFAFAFNWVYVNVLRLKFNDGDNVLNRLNIPFVSWLWDGLCVPTNPALKFGGINHLLVSCINEDELEEVKILSPHISQVFFNPLGGCASEETQGGGYKYSYS